MGWVGWVLFGLLAAPLGALALGEPNSDRSAAEQILATLPSASASARARSPVAEARRALERAAGARKSGDTLRADQLEGLAREWAETARDLARANAAEADAGALSAAAADAGVQAERSRALLEEAIGRRGRAEAELEKLSADGGLFPTAPPPRAKATKAPATSPSARPKDAR